MEPLKFKILIPVASAHICKYCNYGVNGYQDQITLTESLVNINSTNFLMN